MNDPLADLPDAPEWTAKEILTGLVKSSPLLSGKIHFFSYTANEPFTDADPDNLPRPFVRMSIRPQTSSWFAAGMMRYPFECVCELGVDGLIDRPLLALWSAVRTALADQQMAPGGVKTVRQVKQAARITVTEMEMAGYAVSNLGKGIARYLYGLGYMRAEILMNS